MNNQINNVIDQYNRNNLCIPQINSDPRTMFKPMIPDPFLNNAGLTPRTAFVNNLVNAPVINSKNYNHDSRQISINNDNTVSTPQLIEQISGIQLTSQPRTPFQETQTHPFSIYDNNQKPNIQITKPIQNNNNIESTYQPRIPFQEVETQAFEIYNIQSPTFIRSQLDVMEDDINKILNNNISTDRINRLGTSDINNGIEYDKNSLHPEHVMLSQYPKPEGLIQNNITNKTFAETLQEYSIIVDSSDRNIKKYPNPFNYRVYFNPVDGINDAFIPRKFNYVKYIKLDTGILPTKYYYVKQDASLNTINFTTVSGFNLTSNPLNSTFTLTGSGTDISGSFVIINIVDVPVDSSGNTYTRYIDFTVPYSYPQTVDVAYELSFTYNGDSTNINNGVKGIPAIPNNPANNPIYTTNNGIANYIAKYQLQNYNISLDKYSLLNIDEYLSDNENSTNTFVGNSFSVMFPDSGNCDYLYTSSGFIDKIFKFSNLGVLNQMTISISNSNGNLLTNWPQNYTDYNCNQSKTCTCQTNSNGFFVRDYQCCCTYMRHPYYQKFQNVLVFKIGVIENNIDNVIFS
jgi:hypothetical protein